MISDTNRSEIVEETCVCPDVCPCPKGVQIAKQRANVVKSSYGKVSKFEIFVHSWLGAIVELCAYTPLRTQDIQPLTKRETADECMRAFYQQWHSTPTMVMTLLYADWRQVLAGCLSEIVSCAFLFYQPFIFTLLTDYYKSAEAGHDPELWHGIMYALILGVCAFASSSFVLVKFLFASLLAARSRATIIGAVLDKSLRMAPWAQSDTGKTMQLLSNDANRMFEGCLFLHVSYSSPLTIIAALIVMYFYFGNAAFVAVGLQFLLFPYQILMGKAIQGNRIRTIQASDKRVKTINEILNGIRIVKLYAWEDAVQSVLQILRSKELHYIAIGLCLKAVNQCILYVWPSVVTLLTLYMYNEEEGNLSEYKVFLMLSFLNVIRFPISLIPRCLQSLLEANIALERVSEYLNKEEILTRPFLPPAVFRGEEYIKQFDITKTVASQKESITAIRKRSNSLAGLPVYDDLAHNYDENVDDHASQSNIELQSLDADPHAYTTTVLPAELSSQCVYMKELDFYWNSDVSVVPPTLVNMSVSIPRGALIGVVAPVGQGKSSFLNAMLGDMFTSSPNQMNTVSNYVKNDPNNLGTFSFAKAAPSVSLEQFCVRGSVGYFSQDPWLINATLKDNILLGCVYDEAKFDKVIEAAALATDISILPQGITTMIGESGINVSGGQKARIALARLLYRADQLDMVQLDDCFAAVDMQVGRKMFYEGVIGMLRDQGITVIMALNSHLHFLNQCHQVIALGHTSDEKYLLHNDNNNEDKRIPSTILAIGTYQELINKGYGVQSHDEEEEQTADINSQEENMDKIALTRVQQVLLLDEKLTGTPQHGAMSTPVLTTNTSGLLSDDFLLNQDSTVEQPVTKDACSNCHGAGTFGGETCDICLGTGTNRNLLQVTEVLDEENEELILEEEPRHKLSSRSSSKVALREPVAAANEKVQIGSSTSEKVQQGQVSYRTWLTYFKGSSTSLMLALRLFLLITFAAVAQGSKMLIDYWILQWADDEQNEQKHSTEYWVNGAGIIVAVCFSFLLIRSFIMVYINVDEAQYLHDNVLMKTMFAPTFFFDITPLGTILNKLTRDVDTIDTVLPDNLLEFLQQLLQIIGIVVLACISSYVLILPLIPLVIGLLYLQYRFRRTATQLKRIELVTFSPVYSNFSATNRGGSSIRALKLEKQFIENHRQFTDINTYAMTTYNLLQRWFAYRLDFMASCYIFLIAFISVLLADKLSAATIGLAVNYSLQLMGLLQFSVRTHLIIEGCFASVERLLEAQKVPQEPAYISEESMLDFLKDQSSKYKHINQLVMQKLQYNEENNPVLLHVDEENENLSNSLDTIANMSPTELHTISKLVESSKGVIAQKLSGWPWRGEIKLNNITMSYRPNLPIVLNKLSLTIPAGAKVGIVGRTGSGKSSLLLVLFRMVGLLDGEVDIDGVDISHLGLCELRSRMSIIPQQPVMFSGTVRYNVDPFGYHTDEEIQVALQRANIWDTINALPGNIDAQVTEFGANFSQGQRQLLCIARALLRNNPILVLDEATASIDLQTDAQIQQTIASAFQHCTIVTIAHRLDTVVDYDYIMVLRPVKVLDSVESKGEEAVYSSDELCESLAEYDHPFNLLSNSDSDFYKMASQGGQDVFNVLYEKAKNAYNLKQKQD